MIAQKMNQAEFAEVLKALQTDPRLKGATWDRMDHYFSDPDIFTLIVDMPDGRTLYFNDLRAFRRWQDRLQPV